MLKILITSSKADWKKKTQKSRARLDKRSIVFSALFLFGRFVGSCKKRQTISDEAAQSGKFSGEVKYVPLAYLYINKFADSPVAKPGAVNFYHL